MILYHVIVIEHMSKKFSGGKSLNGEVVGVNQSENPTHGFNAACVSGVRIGDTCGSISVPVMSKPAAPACVSFRFRIRVIDAVPLT